MSVSYTHLDVYKRQVAPPTRRDLTSTCGVTLSKAFFQISRADFSSLGSFTFTAVSYTHLDVYKRQLQIRPQPCYEPKNDTNRGKHVSASGYQAFLYRRCV